MVKLHVKKEDESHFLFETTTEAEVNALIRDLGVIYNGRLVIFQLCSEINEMSKYGLQKPSLPDSGPSNKCVPKGGCIKNEDPTGKRDGEAPTEEMKDVLQRTVTEAKSIISNECVGSNICLTLSKIADVFEMLRGALSVVYSTELPDYEPVSIYLNQKLEAVTDLKEAIDVETIELWWAGKQLKPGKKLKDYIGNNEKTKIIVKLQKSGRGTPSREPAISEEAKKQLMLHTYKRQEELKRLEEDEDGSYLDSEWADKQGLRKHFHGVGNISWKAK